MIKKKILKIGIVIGIMSVLSGCGTVSVRSKVDIADKHNGRYEKYTHNNRTQSFRYKPLIGTKQDDTKVLIDMGQFAKIWIKNYRNANHTFVASHDIVTMIKAPGFIAGEDIPTSRRKTHRKSYSGRSFGFRSKDIMYENTSMEDKTTTTKDVKNYIDNVKYSQKFKQLPKDKKVELDNFDKEISKFLEIERKRKGTK